LPVLVAAPTGSGKTLAAFLSAIDDLVREGTCGPLPDETRVLYVSPLKALSSDIAKNLEAPLGGISRELAAGGWPTPAIRTHVRTGDTSARDRARANRTPPHIQVTTPESLYVLLTSEGGRRQLANVRTVIVDEIHAVLRDKRGPHLAMSLERLDALVFAHHGRFPQRIGLSATQKPILEVARFLTGQKPGPACRIIDTGHQRALDLSLWVPSSPLEAVMSNDTWEEVYDHLAELVGQHRTTLVFCNTRRLAERATRFLAERLGAEAVTSHHGSLSRELRQEAEGRLKRGELRALVATASLELGIDVGEVDLVCQLASPGSIATFLQRVGRSGHFLGGTPKGRLFPTSRDDLVECAALLDATRRGELDVLRPVEAPLDILAQQIVASLAAEELGEDELFTRVRAAHPYRNLARHDFDEVVRMLSDGFTTTRGRRAAHVHHDTVGHRLRGRRGARLLAMTNGGAIPENFDYDVVLAPSDQRIGSLHEDFAIESSAGDVFQLGNQSYRILAVGPGTVRVSDARGAPPTIPFWLGEAPARSDEMSASVSRLREWVDEHGEEPNAATRLSERLGVPVEATRQLLDYLLGTKNALGIMPTQRHIVAERFFDETGGMHVVIHAPFGSRFMRAFGLALRKRFCRSFNVELQAAATEDALVLSLGPMHSFPLETVFDFLRTSSVHEVLVQALLDAPLFGTRFRWNASRALAVARFRSGKKVPPRFQRMDSDDLLALCFPDQAACLENIPGDRRIPDHPLVKQTLDDALHEAMDEDALLRVLGAIESGEISCHARDLVEPSPLSHEVIGARPYAFLDDAPLEERRTAAVTMRRFLLPEQAAELGRLDPEAIAGVVREARPDPRDADELHDALNVHGFLTEAEGLAIEAEGCAGAFEQLMRAGRAARVSVRAAERTASLWVARERLAEVLHLHPAASLEAQFQAPPLDARDRRDDAALPWLDLWRGRLALSGPITASELARDALVTEAVAEQGLVALEAEGSILRGAFRPGMGEEFCDRRLLARIHRLTLGRLRQEIEPVSATTFLAFLARHQFATADTKKRGVEGTFAVVSRLRGLALAASAWEESVLSARVAHYDPFELDQLCLSGRVVWQSLPRATAGPVKSTPVYLLPREDAITWVPECEGAQTDLGSDARRFAEQLRLRRASFFAELTRASGLLPAQGEAALRELVARGLANTDSFAGLRTLLLPAEKRADLSRGRRGSRQHRGAFGLHAAGRVSWLGADDTTHDGARASSDPKNEEYERLRQICLVLLERWGVVFRRLLDRETRVPPWRDLIRVFYRMEARGEIRGGRFVAGFSGEQFALPDAVSALRSQRRAAPTSEPVIVSGVDPLNLLGLLTPDARLAATSKNRLLWVDGVAVATRDNGELRLLNEVPGWSAARAFAALSVGTDGTSSRALNRPVGPGSPGQQESPRPS
jgi:ATP-dependent Lhr-like helicase